MPSTQQGMHVTKQQADDKWCILNLFVTYLRCAVPESTPRTWHHYQHH